MKLHRIGTSAIFKHSTIHCDYPSGPVILHACRIRQTNYQRDSHTRHCLPTSASTPPKSLKIHPRAHNLLEQFTPKHHPQLTTSRSVVRIILPVQQHVLLIDNKVRSSPAGPAARYAMPTHQIITALSRAQPFLLEHPLPSCPSWYFPYLKTMLTLNWPVKPIVPNPNLDLRYLLVPRPYSHYSRTRDQ